MNMYYCAILKVIITTIIKLLHIVIHTYIHITNSNKNITKIKLFKNHRSLVLLSEGELSPFNTAIAQRVLSGDLYLG